MSKIMGYDVKKKRKAIMLEPKLVTMKNGRKAWTGKSALSGIKMFRIAKASEL